MTLQELLEKYPKIFDRCIYNIGWHVPETWISLVDELCTEIQKACDEQGHQITCVQMKEKFGALRFYVHQASPEIYTLITKYENMSIEICQECGCKDCNISPTTSEWIIYLCDSCKIKLNKQ